MHFNRNSYHEYLLLNDFINNTVHFFQYVAQDIVHHGTKLLSLNEQLPKTVCIVIKRNCCDLM